MTNQELPRRALDLCLAIYRITAKLPAGEALVGQLRKLANEIAAELSSAITTLSVVGDLAEENSTEIKKKINRLRIYFQIAKAQNWVKPINWSILDLEYYRLQREVIFESAGRGAREKEADTEKASIMSHNIKQAKKTVTLKLATSSLSGLNERQAKIIEVLTINSALKMADLVPLFKNDISERTLRNELHVLAKRGLIKKRGVNKYTEYYKV